MGDSVGRLINIRGRNREFVTLQPKEALQKAE
jgi:hypothetical protein